LQIDSNNNEEIDEMALLDQVISENEKVYQYKTKPMPNIWEKQRKEALKKSLDSKISDQYSNRKKQIKSKKNK